MPRRQTSPEPSLSQVLLQLFRCTRGTFIFLLMLGMTSAMTLRASGSVLCIHPDGTKAVEGVVEKQRCCDSATSPELKESPFNQLSSQACCTDLPLPSEVPSQIISPVVLKNLPSPVFTCLQPIICDFTVQAQHTFHPCLAAFQPLSPQQESLRTVILTI